MDKKSHGQALFFVGLAAVIFFGFWNVLIVFVLGVTISALLTSYVKKNLDKHDRGSR